MPKDVNGQPSSQPDDGSHISKEIRAALKDQPAEIAAGVLRVADRRENLQRDPLSGIPADGTPAKRRSPNGR